MILRRIGNKQRIAKDIYQYFPKHKIYYELFFGAGGMFFNKPKAKYSILNDLDSDVFNLFKVVKDKSSDLEELLSITPMSEELFYHWRDNEEVNEVEKALRFLFLSSFSYLGKSDTFRVLHSDCAYKNKIKLLVKKCSDYLNTSLIRNKHYSEFFDDIYESDAHIPNIDRFSYADPPYLDTTNNYGTPVWTKDDVVLLLDTLELSNVRFAMSEFNHPFILKQANERGLNIKEIGERQTLKNKNMEILITNYEIIDHKTMSLF